MPTLGRYLLSQLDAGANADVTVVIKEGEDVKRLSLHALVLYRSPYFEAALSSSFAEGLKKEVILTDVSSKHMVPLIRVLYSDEVIGASIVGFGPNDFLEMIILCRRFELPDTILELLVSSLKESSAQASGRDCCKYYLGMLETWRRFDLPDAVFLAILPGFEKSLGQVSGEERCQECVFLLKSCRQMGLPAAACECVLPALRRCLVWGKNVAVSFAELEYVPQSCLDTINASDDKVRAEFSLLENGSAQFSDLIRARVRKALAEKIMDITIMNPFEGVPVELTRKYDEAYRSNAAQEAIGKRMELMRFLFTTCCDSTAPEASSSVDDQAAKRQKT